MLNLRKPKEHRPKRTKTAYKLTPLGALSVITNFNSEAQMIYDELKSIATKSCRPGEVPAIIFNDIGGSFVGVQDDRS
jgi:hypothetical protein